MLPEPRNERMVGVNTMNMDGPTLPQPPQPKRRGSLEFYEWIVLLLFLGSLGLGTATTFNLDPDNVGVKEDANVMAWALPFFFLIIDQLRSNHVIHLFLNLSVLFFLCKFVSIFCFFLFFLLTYIYVKS